MERKTKRLKAKSPKIRRAKSRRKARKVRKVIRRSHLSARDMILRIRTTVTLIQPQLAALLRAPLFQKRIAQSHPVPTQRKATANEEERQERMIPSQRKRRSDTKKLARGLSLAIKATMR
jgi:hypothetical protein